MDEHDVRDELASHVALRIEENLSRGLSPDEARREAERRFGPMRTIARQSTRIRRRQSSARRAVLVDLRQAAAAAIRAPLTSIVGALVTAIGLGTVAAAWFLAGALLHTPPAAVARPGELRSVLEALDTPDGPRLRLMSYRAFQALASVAPEARPFAWGQRELQVVHANIGRVVPGTFVTVGYFEALGVRPHAGRLLMPADARENPLICVVSLRLAKALSGDPHTLVGRSVTVNGQPFDIVGIAPVLRAQPLGFDARGVGFVELNPSGAGLTDDERGSLVRRFLETPETGAAMALSDELPFGGGSTVYVAAEDSGIQRPQPIPVTRVAGPYFETLGISLVAGRPFDRRDGSRAVAILSAPLADRMWPGQSGIGRTVRIGGARGTPHEVIGVVAGVRDGALGANPTRRIYLPLGPDFGTLVVLARDGRTEAGSAGLVERTRRLDDRLVALQAGSVDRLVAQSLGQRRALQIVSATIGAGSLLMVAVGVWGLSRATLRRRWREFGIRLALGSTPREVGRLALRDAWIVAGVGGAGGLLAAWQFGRVLQTWLFGVSPHDPGVLALATAVVIAAVVAGALGPARQAARADPAALLRE